MPIVHFLDDSDTWEMLLGYLRVGQGRRTACQSIKMSYRALVEYLQARPDREEDILDAEALFVELIEADLVEAAHTHKQPWAISKILARQGRYADAAAPSTTLVITSADEVGKLLGLIRQRELPLLTVEAEGATVESVPLLLSVEPRL